MRRTPTNDAPSRRAPGVLYGCRAAAEQIRRQGDGGAIVVTSSVHAVATGPPLGLYGASKHAVAYLVGVMAREWGDDGISVNHVETVMYCRGYPSNISMSGWQVCI